VGCLIHHAAVSTNSMGGVIIGHDVDDVRPAFLAVVSRKCATARVLALDDDHQRQHYGKSCILIDRIEFASQGCCSCEAGIVRPAGNRVDNYRLDFPAGVSVRALLKRSSICETTSGCAAAMLVLSEGSFRR